MAGEKRKTKHPGWLYAVGKILLMPFYYLVYRLRVTGRENIPSSGPVLLCSNHVAIKDPILLGVVQRRSVFYMAKEELFRNRFLGGVLRLAGAFPVNRGSGGADALENAERLLRENAQVGIFIEGHRSKTGELQKPKTGAALLAYRTQAPVVPVCITGPGGKRPAPFRRTLIRFGKALPFEELGIESDSSMYLRRGSRKIMESIAGLRESALKELGVSVPQPEAEGPKEEQNG